MKTVYENPWFSVIKDGQYHYIKEVGNQNGAVILAESSQGFVFVKADRKANNGTFIEAPRGYGQPGETACQCAVRELEEETGFKVAEDQMVTLGRLQPNSAILASTVTVFYADIGDTSSTFTDSEKDNLVVIPSPHIQKALSTGRITDGFTLSSFALLWAQ